MNIRLIALLFGLTLSTFVHASESFSGSLTAPNNMQRDLYYTFQIKYDLASDNTFKGTFQSYQSMHCNTTSGGLRVIEGKIEGSNMTFTTDTHELKGCGKHTFRGVKEGDNWVGTMNFQGARRDITFKKD